MLRVNHSIIKKNLLRLRDRLESLLCAARDEKCVGSEKVVLEISHKLRQIEGIILTLNEQALLKADVLLTDLILVIHKLRKDCYRLSRQVPQLKTTFF